MLLRQDRCVAEKTVSQQCNTTKAKRKHCLFCRQTYQLFSSTATTPQHRFVWAIFLAHKSFKFEQPPLTRFRKKQTSANNLPTQLRKRKTTSFEPMIQPPPNTIQENMFLANNSPPLPALPPTKNSRHSTVRGTSLGHGLEPAAPAVAPLLAGPWLIRRAAATSDPKSRDASGHGTWCGSGCPVFGHGHGLVLVWEVALVCSWSGKSQVFRRINPFS